MFGTTRQTDIGEVKSQAVAGKGLVGDGEKDRARRLEYISVL